MKISFNLIKIPAVFLTLTCLLTVNFAQTAVKPPRQEKLLNGMKLLMWNDSSADKVSVKIRLHSGSAFDPQGREGVMQLLADNIFPNTTSREFFADDLGGSLDVGTNYDYIQINATAKPDNLLTMLETLARAVSLPTIDKETTAKLKTARLDQLKELEKSPAYVADQSAAKRFFGTFPYGRPVLGTSESVTKIDFADLILAKQRFLTADNATITVSGNFNSDFAFRAIRRTFGVWEKSDKRVPSTFRQPDDPDAKLSIVNFQTGGSAEIRRLTRGLARNDTKFAVSEIVTQILRDRLNASVKPNESNNIDIRQESHILPGVIVFSQNVKLLAPLMPDNLLSSLLAKNITDEEFNKAKNQVLTSVSRRDNADLWLDADTFRLSSAADEMKSYQNATLSDAESLRIKLAAQPFAAVVVTNVEIKPESAKN